MTNNIEAFQKSISKLLIHPLLWRLTGFGSSIVGFSCYGVSPSFQGMFGHWNPLKIVVYGVVSSLSFILMLFVPRCRWKHGKSLLLKAHVGFVVLMLTSLWSILEEHLEEGKVKKRYGKTMNLTSTGAFALMALSLSRQLQLGFEVGVSNFLVGCLLVTLMKMSIKLAPIAALFCYLLLNVRSISDFLLGMRARSAAQHADDEDTESHHQDTDDTHDDEEFGGYIDDQLDIDKDAFIQQFYSVLLDLKLSSFRSQTQ
ncbi:hypothetical protein PHAVU_002G148200 [Phaseolus vulgaris]|uniref:Transmembrane protein n=1 Tax=Phaseolus vulgaris TaxID=3885 RepID=V7CLY1_PHAVU|nr:hypothetical protein PHAVU_002G148200g [Phaseolus vulgaris]ESW30373.1 hypothetical protein PHAVU_002G148200g [Phaseolus vulgaris]